MAFRLSRADFECAERCLLDPWLFFRLRRTKFSPPEELFRNVRLGADVVAVGFAVLFFSCSLGAVMMSDAATVG